MRLRPVLVLVLLFSVLAACGTDSHPAREIAISGRLLAVGGDPVAPPQRPLPGTVLIAGTPGAMTISVPVGPDGRYSARVRPGRYDIFGQSPGYEEGLFNCKAIPRPVTVRAHDKAKSIDVICSES